MQKNFAFDTMLIKQFVRLAKPFWASELKVKAFTLLFLNIVCILAEIYASVGLNHFNKIFFNALEAYNQPAIVHSLIYFCMLLCLMVASYGYGTYVSGLLAIEWRQWLTLSTIKEWHVRKLLPLSTENPDQRISEDIDLFTAETVDIFSKFFQSSVSLVCFGVILWGLSSSWILPFFSKPIVIPGALCWIALFYAGLGTFLMHQIGKLLAFFDYKQENFQANLRLSLIEFKQPQPLLPNEMHKIHQQVKLVIKNMFRTISLKKNIVFFNNGYNTISYLLGVMILLPAYLAKSVGLGVVMQVSSAFSSVISAFSIFINIYPKLSAWRAAILRLCELKIALKNPAFIGLTTLQSYHGNTEILKKASYKFPV